MNITFKTCLVVAGIIFSGIANANVITNGSFEKPKLNNGQWSVFSSIEGWKTISGPGIEVQNNTLVTAQHGRQYVELDSHGNSTMVQKISGLNTGTDYDLSFWYRARTNNGANDNGINVLWGDAIPGSEIFNIENVKASDGGWVEFTKSLTASADTMYLTFSADGLNNTLGGFIDNVVMTADVPEPGTISLACVGMFGLYLTRRRNCK